MFFSYYECTSPFLVNTCVLKSTILILEKVVKCVYNDVVLVA